MGIPLASAVTMRSNSGALASRSLAQATVSSTSPNMMKAAKDRCSFTLQMGSWRVRPAT